MAFQKRKEMDFNKIRRMGMPEKFQISNEFEGANQDTTITPLMEFTMLAN